jgi:hypothetical protein
MCWSSALPALEESLKRLSALVTYLRTWVDSWVATQPRATKKINPKTTTRSRMEPIRVSQAGSVLWRRCLGRLRGLLGRPDGLGRRDFGAAL